MNVRLSETGNQDAKVVIIGSTTVGKTSIVNRLTQATFTNETTSTVGTSFVSKAISTGDVHMTLQIWDTGGSERYRSMVPLYFHNADGAVIVYDITSRESFNDAESWFRELQEKGPTHITVALAGNKSDMERMREVDEASGRAFAADRGIAIFRETSALTGDNIEEIFVELAKGIAAGGTSLRPSRKAQIRPAEPAKKNCDC